MYKSSFILCTSHAFHCRQELFQNWMQHAICRSLPKLRSPTSKPWKLFLNPDISTFCLFEHLVGCDMWFDIWLHDGRETPACAQNRKSIQRSQKSQSPRPGVGSLTGRPLEVMPAVYNEPFLLLADNKALTSIVSALLIIKKGRSAANEAT